MYLEPGDFIGSRLYFFGVWEPSISAFMRERVSPGSVAIDIGANIGYYSLLLANAVGSAGRVYAIEPAAFIIEKQQANIALNRLMNVNVIPFGISDKPERRAFVLEAQNLGASHFGEVSDSGVQLVRLKSVIDPADLPRVSMIKVDVEGFEAAVLQDILTLVSDLGSPLTIIGEIRNTPETHALFHDFCRAGFSTFMLNNEYRLPDFVEWKVVPPSAGERTATRAD